MAHLILASSSPRRKQLLEQLNIAFEVYSPDIDETVQANEAIADYVERLARHKAKTIQQQFPQSIVLAADTSVGVDQHILAQPQSKAHAFEMWSALSGRKHQVYSGVCVCTATQCLSIVVCTEVEFQELSHNDMECYWATGEPPGKAGAYAIQGMAAQYIPRIEGSYSNVVGLPLYETVQLLKAVKVLN